MILLFYPILGYKHNKPSTLKKVFDDDKLDC